MPVYALFATNPATGHLTVLTFSSLFDRALEIIARRDQILRTADYTV